jgi:hypothetical protein
MEALRNITKAAAVLGLICAQYAIAGNAVDRIDNQNNALSYSFETGTCGMSTSAHVFFKKGKARTLTVTVFGMASSLGEPTGEVFDTRVVEFPERTDMLLNVSGLNAGAYGDFVGVSWELSKNNGVTAMSVKHEQAICGCIGCGGGGEPIP